MVRRSSLSFAREYKLSYRVFLLTCTDLLLHMVGTFVSIIEDESCESPIMQSPSLNEYFSYDNVSVNDCLKYEIDESLVFIDTAS